MKCFKYLILSLALLLIAPLAVFAEGEEATTTATDNKVNVYFFRGDGCPHCQEAQEWFNSIQEEYGEKYKIVDYETWYNEDNSALMSKVAEFRGEEEKATGVPYIIIGDKSWVGFSAETMGEEIKSQINDLYNQEVSARYDVMSLMNGTEKKTSNGSDVLALIIILIVVGGICFGVYKARNSVN